MKHEYDLSDAKRGRFRRAIGPLKLPHRSEKAIWRGPDDALGRFAAAQAGKTLEAYRALPQLVAEHADQEYDAAHLADRQLYELIQNGADALAHEGTGQSILVRLTRRFLYCADDGKPLDEEGLNGLMSVHVASRRGTVAVGRIGIGFKSVLAVTDAPELYSRSGSVRFSRTRAVEQIGGHAKADRCPMLQLPVPVDAEAAAASDDDLSEMMSWATNIVRLPLAERAFLDLATQVQEFRPEFLRLVPHVKYVTLECEGQASREFMLQDDGKRGRLEITGG